MSGLTAIGSVFSSAGQQNVVLAVRIKIPLRLVLGAVGLLMLSRASVAAEATWLGAFGHVPTTYNLSPPATITGRDGNPRTVPANYAPLPPYPAATTVREVVRLSAAAHSIRIRLSNEFAN